MEFKFSIYGILLLAGGILALISLFFPWLSGTLFGIEYTLSGWEIFSDGEYDYYFIPIMVLVFAAMVIGTAVDEFIGRFASVRAMLRVIALILGALIVILPIFLLDDICWLGGWTEYYFFAGFYMVVAAGALIVVSAILSLLKARPEPAR